MSFVVEPGTPIHLNMCLTFAAATVSFLASLWMLATYRKFRSALGNAFNNMIAVVAVVQMVEVGQKWIVCLVAFSTHRVPFLLCDVSGSIEQVTDVMEQSVIISFFLFLASPSARRRGVAWRMPYIVSTVLSLLSLAVCWIFVYDGGHAVSTISPSRAPIDSTSSSSSMHFTLQLGWCWLPEDAAEYRGFSQSDLTWVRFCCSYLFSIFFFLSSVVALVSIWRANYRAGGSATIPAIVVIRIIGEGIFPVFAYGLGAVARFTASGENNKDDAAASFVFPFNGCWTSLMFLFTERALCALTCNNNEDTGPITFPGGFADAIHFLSCGLSRGEQRRYVDVDTMLLRGSIDPNIDGRASGTDPKTLSALEF